MATAPDRSAAPNHAPESLRLWVLEVAARTRPAQVHWCDGSEAEYRELVRQMLANGDLMKLNAEAFPGCYLHRSHPSDVARVEHLTFVCTDAARRRRPEQPLDGAGRGATQDGRAVRRAHARPHDVRRCRIAWARSTRRYSRCGVEITDSAYVVANMRIMTRMGAAALARIERDGTFVKGLHSIGELDPRAPLHHAFPRGARRSRASARATAATRCSARSATRCASRAGRRATRAGSPSTC